MINFNLCDGCPKFEKQKKIVLNESESVFDAAVDMQDFITECQKHCDRIGVIKDE